jgi:antitoxin (DNA-binding transcriptional repressor) of toxin-antitoxin stability system
LTAQDRLVAIVVMVTVGVDQLRAGLSDYLTRVQQGETVLVTAGGVVIATMSPPESPATEAEPCPGSVPPLLPKEGWTWQVRGAGLPEGTAQAVLDEIRAERLDFHHVESDQSVESL